MPRIIWHLHHSLASLHDADIAATLFAHIDIYVRSLTPRAILLCHFAISRRRSFHFHARQAAIEAVRLISADAHGQTLLAAKPARRQESA